MSRVTYLLGAGASFGERGETQTGRKTFLRGLPVINEIQDAVLELVRNRRGDRIEANELKMEPELYAQLIDGLRLFREMCTSYPTIDTLAKQLFVTKRPYVSHNGTMINYEQLKTLLAVTLLMLQSKDKRDLRYDGFIASLIKKDHTFPPMTILSWNYDAQFELAYSGYYLRDQYIPTLWEELNVLNKTYPTEFDVDKPFAMIKLNGTAFFTDIRYATTVNGREVPGLKDCFFGSDELNKYQYGAEYLLKSVYHNTLSYSWENSTYFNLMDSVLNRVIDTEEMIVIGYSFPYVNNEVDSYYLQRMGHLQKVVIQDKNFDDIKERIEGILEPTGRHVEIIPKNNLQQFYIPNKF